MDRTGENPGSKCLFCTDRGSRGDNISSDGRCAEERTGSTGASGGGSAAVSCSCEQRQQERPGSEVGGAGCSVILFKRSTS